MVIMETDTNVKTRLNMQCKMYCKIECIIISYD